MIYSNKISFSAFHAGSTIHKNLKSTVPVFSIHCFEFGGTYTESSFSSLYDLSLIFSVPFPSKI